MKMNNNVLFSIWEHFAISFLYLCGIIYIDFNISEFPKIKCIGFPNPKIYGELSINNLNELYFKNNNLNNKILSWTKIVESKFFIEWANFNSSYHILCPKNATSAQYYFPTILAREYSRYLHIQNAYCTPSKALAIPNYILKIYNVNSFVKVRDFKVEYGYKNIIYLYSSWGNIFGHFIHDSLATLLKFPKELIDDSMIMVSFPMNICSQYFEIFNISKDKILCEYDKWYYAQNLYLHYPYENCFGYMSITFPKLVKILREKTGVNNIKGYRYIFSNRPQGASRHVDNFIEFYNITKKLYPEYNWEIDVDINYLNFKEIAKTFATFKFLVAPSGSNTVNMLYMNRNYTTGICLIHSISADFAIFANVLMAEIWTTGFCNYWEQHHIGVHNCDIYYGITCIKRLIYALQFNRWPNSTFNDMKEAFDFPEICKLTKQNSTISRMIYIGNEKYHYPISNQVAYDFP